MTQSYFFSMADPDPYLANLLATFATTVSSCIDNEVAKVNCRSLNAATALVTIWNHPDDSIDVLRQVLNVTHSGAVRLINGLEEDLLVTRHSSKNDGRFVLVRLTKEGRKVAKQVLQMRTNVANDVLGALSKGQQTELRPVLENVLKMFTDEFPSARRICRLCDERVCRPKGCPVEISACEFQEAE